MTLESLVKRLVARMAGAKAAHPTPRDGDWLPPASPGALALDLKKDSIRPAETPLLRQLVEGTRCFSGPIVEIGTLFGMTTTEMALWDRGGRKIITVDNYSWNPWGLSSEDHRALAGHVLHYLSSTGRVEVVTQDKNEFYQAYHGPAPSLVFLDAIHDYPETKKDIEWARNVGARVIAGHDYSDVFPGVRAAVDEAGGPHCLCGSLWVLEAAAAFGTSLFYERTCGQHGETVAASSMAVSSRER